MTYQTLTTTQAESLPVAQPTPAGMLQLAIEKGASIEQLELLMDLQERLEANEARKAFVKAMAEFKASPPIVRRSRQVSYERRDGSITSYYHAPLEEVCSAAIPGLSKVGISHRWENSQQDGLITVSCILTHVMGHSERTTLSAAPDSSDGKNPVQAIASTINYLQRYTMLGAIGLAAEGMDDDAVKAGSAPEVITEKQKTELESLAKKVKADMAGFLKYLEVDSLDDLPASRMQKAVAALNAKGRGKK